MRYDPEHVVVRVATAADGPAFARIYGPFVSTTAVTFEERMPSDLEMSARVVATLEKLPWLAATVNGATIGFAYASRHRERSGYRWAVDVSAYVDAEQRGRGVGRMLYDRLLPTVTELGYYRACAGIALPNDASVALHRATGFELVGTYRGIGYKAGIWRDVSWWQCNLREGTSEPADPRRFDPQRFR